MASKANNQPEYLNLVAGELKSKRRAQKGRVAAKTAHTMYTMGDAYNAADGWTIILASVPLYFYITTEMIARAVKKSGRYCVIGQAFEAIFGKDIAWQVGPGLVKIWDVNAKIEVRFVTPGPLQRAIREFDPETGYWPLPANMYRLLPFVKSTIDRLKGKKRAAAKRVKKKDGKQSSPATLVVKNPVRRRRRKPAPASRTVLRNARMPKNGWKNAG